MIKTKEKEINRKKRTMRNGKEKIVRTYTEGTIDRGVAGREGRINAMNISNMSLIKNFIFS